MQVWQLVKAVLAVWPVAGKAAVLRCYSMGSSVEDSEAVGCLCSWPDAFGL
jgi:hypothetical protein